MAAKRSQAWSSMSMRSADPEKVSADVETMAEHWERHCAPEAVVVYGRIEIAPLNTPCGMAATQSRA